MSTITTKPQYTFRKLNATDIFLMCKILGKIGVNEFLNFFTGEKNIAKLMGCMKGGSEADMMEFGLSIAKDLANVLFENLPKCESEVYQMLSNTSNLTVDQVKDLDMITFTTMVIDFIKKEEFKDFVGVASKLFK